MPAFPQQSGDSAPFTMPQNQTQPIGGLSHTAIIGLVVCMVATAIAGVAVYCLLSRCWAKRQAKALGQPIPNGHELYDNRNMYQAWNKNAAPLPPVPEYPGYGTEMKGNRKEDVQPLAKAAVKPAGAVMEPMVGEEGGQELFTRSSRKGSRYYTGSNWAKRFSSRFSHIGVAK